MASEHSFDVVSRVDFQEVENALNQARKEIGTRYDFRGSDVTITRVKEKITVVADDEFRLKAALDILNSKFIRRGVPLKNIEFGKATAALGGRMRQELTIRSGIPADACKAIVKAIKDAKMKKVQTSIQGDQVRISSKSKDDLQAVIALLKEKDFGVELQFTNYR
ncbi:MAG: YajQ family cyclic di-GMP-binding protein [Candidatus Hydrogenedentota bacterium]|nr:MAG: YajQ family cyclic di-GMP-binding protein [Candidatus Hydrogenedentota bacterium]